MGTRDYIQERYIMVTETYGPSYRYRCSHCGTKNPINKKFCIDPQCGRRICHEEWLAHVEAARCSWARTAPYGKRGDTYKTLWPWAGYSAALVDEWRKRDQEQKSDAWAEWAEERRTWPLKYLTKRERVKRELEGEEAWEARPMKTYPLGPQSRAMVAYCHKHFPENPEETHSMNPEDITLGGILTRTRWIKGSPHGC
jgi:hypothetical protein